MRSPLLVAAGAAAVALFTAGCDRVEDLLPGFSDPLTPRESYVAALDSAGLRETALVRDWLAAGDGAFESAVTVRTPFSEEGYFAPERPSALAWRFTVQRGRRIEITAGLGPDSAGVIFLDAFEVVRAGSDSLRLVRSAERGARQLQFEPRADGEYLLRVQPELLAGGRYHIEIRSDPALAFPVEGRSSRAIQSVFGDARDGGRRNHHGVDIFAPRGTPVLAAGRGYVRSVRATPRGGNVVWLTDEQRGLSLYYAHLDTQLVERGQYVDLGDTLGLVGNSGNARSTPPHLHFGIYRRGEGPIDPWWFVHDVTGEPARLAVDTTTFGDWTRTTVDEVRLRAGPDDDAAELARLGRHTALEVIGGAGSWYRVELPDGTHGFIAARLTEAALRPVRSERLAQSAPLQALPTPAAAIIERLAPGDVPVLAEFGGYLLVRPSRGVSGWLAIDE